MINLIPPKAKKELLIEYWARVVSVWAYLIGVAVVAGVFVLVPAYVLITSQINAYESSADAARAKTDSYETVSTELIQASQQARFVVDESEVPVMSSLVAEIFALEGEGISLTVLGVRRDGTAISSVTLDGVAADRQTLASLRDRLLNLENVASVDFPISNLAQDQDILFSMVITFTTTPTS